MISTNQSNIEMATSETHTLKTDCEFENKTERAATVKKKSVFIYMTALTFIVGIIIGFIISLTLGETGGGFDVNF